MKLPSAAALVFAALLLLPLSSFAADAPAGSAPGGAAPTPGTSPTPGAGNDNGAADLPVNPYLAGEQLIGLAAGLHIPTFLLPVTDHGASNLDLGISFTFSYQYFVSRGFGIGGSISGTDNGTIGGNSVFTAPLGVTASYWWAKLPFEFSVLSEAGAYLMHYNNSNVIDPFAKAGAGIYWRAVASWSFGLQAYFWLIPEIHYGSYADLTQYGGFVETSLAAIYHL